MKKHRVRGIIYIVLFWFFFVAARLIRYLLVWSVNLYGEVPFAQIVFHLRAPLEGTDSAVVRDAVLGFVKDTGPVAVLLLAVLVLAYIVSLKWNHESVAQFTLKVRSKTLRLHFRLFSFCKTAFAVAVIAMLAVQFVTAYRTLDIRKYIYDQTHASTIYEEYYVDAGETAITFPEQKKNLIFIFCESMESTYSAPEYGGDFADNLIPNLTQLALENDNFAPSGDIGGAYAATNGTWTSAALVTQTSGTPLSVPIDTNAQGENIAFLPGLTSLGDLLEDAGYNQMFLLGSGAAYGGRRNYFVSHGNYEIWDYYTAKELNYIPSDYHVFWGYEDAKLFSFAKEQILNLAETGKPFNATLLTVDTHFPDGYTCELCEDTYEEPLLNAIACSDRQIADFVAWIQGQDFYENTVIVIAGDHPNMATLIGEMTSEGYRRDVYFTVINSAVADHDDDVDTGRIVTTLDVFPTTLAALGCTIPGDRLGFGTNLYSDRPTIADEFGLKELNEELAKTSRYYDQNIVQEKK